ncbi:MAG: hypothetical protein P1U83_07665 [Roseovarius sp.]|nr:hypothetical protein [Roseovarius sp.]
MKISHNTASLLILDHVPWVLAMALASLFVLFVGIGLVPLGLSDEPMLWLFAFMFSVVGGGLWLLMLELFARRLQFVFDRNTDRITIRRQSLFRRFEVNHKLSRLIEARLQTDVSEGGQALYRPVLVLHAMQKGKAIEKPMPLHDYFTSGSGPENMCEAVNTWLSHIPKIPRN